MMITTMTIEEKQQIGKCLVRKKKKGRLSCDVLLLLLLLLLLHLVESIIMGLNGRCLKNKTTRGRKLRVLKTHFYSSFSKHTYSSAFIKVNARIYVCVCVCERERENGMIMHVETLFILCIVHNSSLLYVYMYICIFFFAI